MKYILALAAVLLATSLAWVSAEAQETRFAYIDAYYEVSSRRGFASECSTPPNSGYSCVEFPNGATITGVTLQAIAKSGDAMFILISWPSFNTIAAARAIAGVPAAGGHIHIPLSNPIVLGPGERIFLIGEGVGSLEFRALYHVRVPAGGSLTFRRLLGGAWDTVTE